MSGAQIHGKVATAAEHLGGEFNVTLKGVPRVILHLPPCKVSLVYLATSNQWKVFWPFPAKEQERRYFDNMDAVERFVNDVKTTGRMPDC